MHFGFLSLVLLSAQTVCEATYIRALDKAKRAHKEDMYNLFNHELGNITLDWVNRPSWDSPAAVKVKGFWLWSDTIETKLLVRETLQDKRPTAIALGEMINAEYRIEYVYVSYTEPDSIINNVGSTTPMSLGESTVSLKSATHGWNATSQIRRSPEESGKSKSREVHVSSFNKTEYKDWSSMNSKTVSVRDSHNCPAQHQCHFETWTAYVKYTGWCNVEPKARCQIDGQEKEIDLCSKNSDACPNADEFRKSHCHTFKGATLKVRVKKCSFLVPVLDDHQKPYSRVVIAEFPRANGPPRLTAVIADHDKPALFMLDDGWWYNEVTDEYYENWDSKSGVKRDDVQRPIIPDSVRLI
ncbi:hypothetical protein CDD83_8059 [Cordyceps sp. RAO-2017]|nr:hypothetical protein CDD83_8059 [Cordyceps sp. RAO-2017]